MMECVVNPTPMSNSDSNMRSLFAPEDIVRWKKEHKRLTQQREVINMQINALDRMLSGADLYGAAQGRHDIDVPLFTAAQENTPAADPAPLTPPATMHEAIVRAVQQHPKGLEPREIAAALKAAPDLSPKIKQSHPNYLYTALARLVNKDEIYKSGSVYKIKNRAADPAQKV
jgi:hypothetical protein